MTAHMMPESSRKYLERLEATLKRKVYVYAVQPIDIWDGTFDLNGALGVFPPELVIGLADALAMLRKRWRRHPCFGALPFPSSRTCLPWAAREDDDNGTPYIASYVELPFILDAVIDMATFEVHPGKYPSQVDRSLETITGERSRVPDPSS